MKQNTRVIHVTLKSESAEDIDAACSQVRSYIDTGVVQDGASIVEEDYETFSARGRVPDCDCGLIQCACAEARKHKVGCRYRTALTCAIPIECDHGFDVCPQCDACTCEMGTVDQ
jgi:hypothetical protein